MRIVWAKHEIFEQNLTEINKLLKECDGPSASGDAIRFLSFHCFYISCLYFYYLFFLVGNVPTLIGGGGSEVQIKNEPRQFILLSNAIHQPVVSISSTSGATPTPGFATIAQLNVSSICGTCLLFAFWNYIFCLLINQAGFRWVLTIPWRKKFN